MRRWSASTIAAASALLVAVGLLTASPSSAATTYPGHPLVVCPGFSGLNTATANTYQDLERGYVTIMGRRAKVLDPSTGVVNWSADPFSNSSWRIWFHSVKWIADLVYTASGRHAGLSWTERQKALTLATRIVHSYMVSNTGALSRPTTVQKSSSGHRAQAIGCLIETLGSSTPSWLRSFANADAAWLLKSSSYLGAWNQGLDQDLGVITIGCVDGNSAARDAAVRRASATMETNIDPQGATTEQSVGYGAYGYALWTKVIRTMDTCGVTPPAVAARVQLVPEFIAWATTPTGRLEQLGDTFYDLAPNIPSTPAQYVATLGTQGTAPAGLVKLYSRQGYVFGRSAWTDLTHSSYYSLRYGPRMNWHGHADKTSLTYWVGGREIVTDSGHIGYNDSKARIYLKSAEAHNIVTTPARSCLRTAGGSADLTLFRQYANAEYYLITDRSLGMMVNGVYKPYTKTRAVFVLHNPDVMVVVDRIAGGASDQVWQQRFHMAPGMSRVSGTSRSATFNDGTTLSIVPTASSSSSTSVVSGWVARSTGVKTADQQVVSTAKGSQVRFVTVIAPSSSTTWSYDASLGQLTILQNGSPVSVLQLSGGGLSPLG